MKDTPFEVISKSLNRVDGSDLEDILDALNTILKDKHNREFLLGSYKAEKFAGVAGISQIRPGSITFLIQFECDNWDEGTYITSHEISRDLLEDESHFETENFRYWNEKRNKEIIKNLEESKRKKEAEYAQYLELKKKFEKNNQ